MRKTIMKVLVCNLVLTAAGSAYANDEYFIRAKGEIAGSPVDIDCTKKGTSPSRELSFDGFASEANKKFSWQIACSKSGQFAGLSFGFVAGEDALKLSIPAFDGSKALEALPGWFTFRVNNGKSKEVNIHSFITREDANVRQHFSGSPVLKITEYTRTEEGGKVFYTFAGSTSVDFVEKNIQGKKLGSAGKVEFSFRAKAKRTCDPATKNPC